jgi:gliding motility-associated-like protein
LQKSNRKFVAYWLVIFLFGGTHYSIGQIFNAPQPAPNQNPPIGNTAWSAICASNTFNDYWVNFTWSPPLVGANNEFILELSDASGNFNNPTELDRVSDKNISFDFYFRFSLPESIAGEGYKMRVRGTSPEIIGPESEAFPMHFLDYTSGLTIRPQGASDFGNGTIAVCDGNLVTLEVYNLSNTEERIFNWYKNGVLIAERTSLLQVTEGGLYSVELDYGSCAGSGNTMSNQIQVLSLNSTGITLDIPEKTALCLGESVLLTAGIESSTIIYTWYKDGEPISLGTAGEFSYLVDASQSNFQGTYQVEISGPNLCQERSEGIEIRNLGDFTVDRVNAESYLMIPGQAITLSVTTDAQNYEVQWYRNNLPLNAEISETLELQSNMEGTYFARVSLTEASCAGIFVDSDQTTVILPSQLTTQIATESGYEPCESSVVAFGIAEISAIDESGNSIEVTETLRNQVDWEWYKDGVLLPEISNWFVELSDPLQNGTYKAIGFLENYTLETNEIEILLSPNENLEISASSYVFCSSTQSITLSTTADGSGASLNWFHNGQIMDEETTEILVTQPGTYELWLYRGTCPVYSNQIDLLALNEELVTISPGQSVQIQEGSNTVLTANGGEAYLWYDADNVVLGQGPEFKVSKDGIYYLVAKLEGCDISKTITVSYIENSQIPNVVSSNGDGINDLWILPGIYASKADVTVIIYNRLGQEVFHSSNYQNNWPTSTVELSQKSEVFYFNIVKGDTTLKQGTITVIR